jgi:SAM-dependent methyltransferase
MLEDSYGRRKRIKFLIDVIKNLSPNRVLDIGCGTGVYVLFPLARLFPMIYFLGVDKDDTSIEFARNNNKFSNLNFARLNQLDANNRFDLIIASEVIEHVEEPEEFLFFLKERLMDSGNIVLTVPNGYGPFEIASFIETMLYLCGIYKVVKRAKHVIFASSSFFKEEKDTLAISPHINFFSYGQISELIGKVGLEILRYRPRTLLCGFGFDYLLQRQRLRIWNAKITDSLPPYFSSDWMFLLRKGQSKRFKGYKRNLYSIFRKYLNEKRWGVAY